MLIVFADDLTGAAEIAAAGFRFHFDAQVFSGEPGELNEEIEQSGNTLLVINTDTRLMVEEEADKRIAAFCRKIPGTEVFFKKIDSLLRGNVLREIQVMVEGSWCEGAILLPQNPSLGRTVADGIYYVNGIPLHETALTTDPELPDDSSSIYDLLGPEAVEQVHLMKPGMPLPKGKSILFCEAVTAEDVRHWARSMHRLPGIRGYLPAGGSDFFCAFMEDSFEGVIREPFPWGRNDLPPVLFYLSGSSNSVSRKFFEAKKEENLHSITLPGNEASRNDFSADTAYRHLHQWLEKGDPCVLRVGDPVIYEKTASTVITGNLATLGSKLIEEVEIPHLYVEGGATAAALLKKCGWSRFRVVKAWNQGAVTLEVLDPETVSARSPLITLKPSSFPWPKSLSPV